MSDDTVAGCAAVIAALSGGALMVHFVIVTNARMDAYLASPLSRPQYKDPPWPWRVTLMTFAIAALSFLWAPWVSIVVVKVYRANWNAVNYVNRPDEVQPVPGKVYRADQKPVEAP